MSYHEAIRRTRTGSAYTTDDGEEIPQHILTAFDCGCGYRAFLWLLMAAAIVQKGWRRFR